MPTVEIADKNMVVEFPDDMSSEEIERAIYSDVYNQPVISQGQEPSLMQRGKQYLLDLVSQTPEPKIGQAVTREDIEAFRPAEVDIASQAIQEKPAFSLKSLMSAETPEIFKQSIFPSIPKDRKEAITERLKPISAKHFPDEMPDFSNLDETLGKAADVAVNFVAKAGMTSEEEMTMARLHPNLMAARYAITKLLPETLIPGMTWLISPTDWENFKKQSTQEQQDEILGESLGWAVAPPVLKVRVNLLDWH